MRLVLVLVLSFGIMMMGMGINGVWEWMNVGGKQESRKAGKRVGKIIRVVILYPAYPAFEKREEWIGMEWDEMG